MILKTERFLNLIGQHLEPPTQDLTLADLTDEELEVLEEVATTGRDDRLTPALAAKIPRISWYDKKPGLSRQEIEVAE